LKKSIYQAARDTISLEDDFIDTVFSGGEIEGITAYDVKQFIRFRANTKLGELGLKMNWKNIDMEAVGRMGWFDLMTSGVEHTDFFAQKVTAYSKGHVDFSNIWD